MSAKLSELSRIENERLASVDAPAEIFGDILAAIVSHGLEGAEARIASAVGHGVGKWIYIADALDDLEDDAKKNRYNPFLLLYGKMPEREALLSMETAMKNELCSVEAALELIDFDNEIAQNIIFNILYIGCPEKIKEILGISECSQKRSKKRSKQTDTENEKTKG